MCTLAEHVSKTSMAEMYTCDAKRTSMNSLPEFSCDRSQPKGVSPYDGKKDVSPRNWLACAVPQAWRWRVRWRSE